MFSCRGKLFFVSDCIQNALCYDPESNLWCPAPWSTDSNLQEFTAVRGRTYLREVVVDNSDISFIMRKGKFNWCSDYWMWKYDLDANQSTIPVAMTEIGKRDDYHKQHPCVVAVDKYIYFIGGITPYPCNYDFPEDYKSLSHCARFDTRENEWQDTANLQQARHLALGAAAHGKIFIAGGYELVILGHAPAAWDELKTCEVYNVGTDEWHCMASLKLTVGPRGHGHGMVFADDTLYVLSNACESGELIVQCYDHGKDEWNVKKRTRLYQNWYPSCVQAGVFRIFKGDLDKLASCADFSNSSRCWPPMHTSSRRTPTQKAKEQ